jgi:OmcA/MtrC family decaheme c-type cytochrome
VAATNPADKSLPPQSVNFAQMIHKIHTGEHGKVPPYGREDWQFTIVGYGGSHNDFCEVRYPAFSLTGEAGDRRNCSMCHVNGSEQLPLQQDGLSMVKDPQGLINPVGPITSACTGCHTSLAAASHALANTSELGESCAVCHGTSAEYAVSKVHAQ